jgi:hypothetical protein
MNGCLHGLWIPSGETSVGHSPRGALRFDPIGCSSLPRIGQVALRSDFQTATRL